MRLYWKKESPEAWEHFRKAAFMTQPDKLIVELCQESSNKPIPGYCQDWAYRAFLRFLGVVHVAVILKKQTEQARICEENSDFYPTKTMGDK